jgi:hypothetical protein
MLQGLIILVLAVAVLPWAVKQILQMGEAREPLVLPYPRKRRDGWRA